MSALVLAAISYTQGTLTNFSSFNLRSMRLRPAFGSSSTSVTSAILGSPLADNVPLGCGVGEGVGPAVADCESILRALRSKG